MSIEKLKGIRAHVRTWLDQTREAQQAEPEARQIEERLDWQVRALQRPEVYSISEKDLEAEVDQLAGVVQAAFPLAAPVGRSSLARASSITASGASSFVAGLSQVARTCDEDTARFASKMLDDYGRMQVAQRRHEVVRELIRTNNISGCVDSLDRAQRAFEKWRSIASPEHGTAAANEMRNFLDALQGELFAMVRRPSEQKASLQLVFDRLLVTAEAAPEVKKQVRGRSALYGDLSAVLKNRPSSNEVGALWTRVLDHAFVILGALVQFQGQGFLLSSERLPGE